MNQADKSKFDRAMGMLEGIILFMNQMSSYDYEWRKFDNTIESAADRMELVLENGVPYDPINGGWVHDDYKTGWADRIKYEEIDYSQFLDNTI